MNVALTPVQVLNAHLLQRVTISQRLRDQVTSSQGNHPIAQVAKFLLLSPVHRLQLLGRILNDVGFALQDFANRLGPLFGLGPFLLFD